MANGCVSHIAARRYKHRERITTSRMFVRDTESEVMQLSTLGMMLQPDRWQHTFTTLPARQHGIIPVFFLTGGRTPSTAIAQSASVRGPAAYLQRGTLLMPRRLFTC
jgi:hypothetical protein